MYSGDTYATRPLEPPGSSGAEPASNGAATHARAPIARTTTGILEGRGEDPVGARWRKLGFNEFNLSWDWVIVFRNRKHPDVERETKGERMEEEQQFRRQLVQKIKEANLMVSKQYSSDEKELYLRIGASEHFLEEVAERAGLRLRLREEYGGAFSSFMRGDKFKYERQSGSRMFSSAQRVQLIDWVLGQEQSEGGAGVFLTDLVKEAPDFVLAVYPLHDKGTKGAFANLRENWAAFPKMFTKGWTQPIHDIYRYFGAEIAMYFAFLGYYTKWLGYVCAVGLVAAYFQYTDMEIVRVVDPVTHIEKEMELRSYDGKAVPFFCIFLAVAASLLLEGWKREQAIHGVMWDQYHAQKVERVRFEFNHAGIDELGFYNEHGDWVDLSGSNVMKYPDKLVKSKYVSKKKLLWLGVQVTIMTFLFAVIGAALVIFAFRNFVYNTKGPSWGGAVGGVLFAVTINTLNFTYRKVAVMLNDKENHRTQSAYDHALALKIFVFQFVNSYVTYFWIAFVKPYQIEIFGFRQQCLEVTPGGPPNCMFELQRQLSSIFFTQIAIGNVLEVFIPYVKQKWRLIKASKTAYGGANAPKKVESERYLEPFGGVLDDFNEIMIQFGQVTLFASAFPLAALLALLNNLVEIRSDAYKLIHGSQRPTPGTAKDIGSWMGVMQAVSSIAVVTNAAMVIFTSDVLDPWFSSFKNPAVVKVLTVIAIEHVVFLIKIAIDVAIPDMPRSIRTRIARQKFMSSIEGRYQKELEAQRKFEARRERRAEIIRQANLKRQGLVGGRAGAHVVPLAEASITGSTLSNAHISESEITDED